MTNKLAVVFDLDGTLTDSKPGVVNCLRKALTASGTPWDGPLDWFIGPPIQQSIVRLMPDGDDAARSVLIRHYRECYDRTGWADNAVYAGVPELLQTLRARGNRLFLCTSKPERFTLRILEKFALDQYFISVYSDREQKPHSKVDLLANLLEEQGLNPAAAVMVGDRHFDIEAATINGLHSIAVTYGYGSAGELEEARPTAICSTPLEVLSAIDSAWGAAQAKPAFTAGEAGA
ncbi:MAG TPA: HAD-IA family hydrolase [Acidisarcina sp.]